MLSVIIPSRQPEFLQKTVDDLLLKAEGEIEVIVVFDGYWPEVMLTPDKRVRILQQGVFHENFGMRRAINDAVKLANGEFIMKIDEHCMLDQGYDLKLASSCHEEAIVIPRRKRLNPDDWELIEDGRPPIDYMFVSYPYKNAFDRSSGLYGAEDKQLYYRREGLIIDETMTMQGSCWFLRRDYFYKLLPDGMDESKYGMFNHEAQELSNTCWLSGGQVLVNKDTWYAHYHKGNRGKGYGFSNAQYKKFTADKEKARRFAIDYWLTTEDFKYNWKWLMEHFWPVPTWPEDWYNTIKTDARYDWRNDPSQQPTEWIE